MHQEEDVMTTSSEQMKYTRRSMLKTTGAVTFGAALITSGAMIACPRGTWAVTARALSPDSMVTLIQMARDIYPHDRVADSYYAGAVAAHDEKAADDADFRQMMEDGVAGLNLSAQGKGASAYVQLGWEADRVAILRSIEKSGFFQTVRGGLVVGIYNDPALWPLFGYEGESASKGGYLTRGFDDISWL